MPNSPAPDLLKALYNALPLSAHLGMDLDAIYVQRADDAEHDSVAKLRQYIEWSEDGNESYLFSGLRGAGKTTELLKLMQVLKADGIATFYCDAADYLNLHDPEIGLPELLMTAMAGLADAVRKEFGAALLKDSIWQRAKRLLTSDVALKPSVSVPINGVEFGVEATLQENPDFRKALAKFARSSTAFYDEVNDFAAAVAAVIRQEKRCEKIVLLVDSLERLSAPSGEESKLFDSLKEVFFNDPARLRFAGFSVIYSAPPYLHAVLPNVAAGFTQCVSLPNFKVIEKPSGVEQPQPSDAGIAKMLEVLAHRFPQWESVLSRAVAQHLAFMSGGNVRSYFSLLRILALKAKLSQAALPINETDAAAVAHTLSEAAQPLQWLNAQDRIWLKHFMNSAVKPASHILDMAKDLPSIIRLFDHSLVLDYKNGEIWYQVPPLVREHV